MKNQLKLRIVACLLAATPLVVAQSVTFSSVTNVTPDGGYLPSLLPTTVADVPKYAQRKVSGVQFRLPEAAATALRAQLPVRADDTWTPELAAAVLRIVGEFDSHLGVYAVVYPKDRGMSLLIAPRIDDTRSVRPAIQLPAAPPGVFSGGDGVTPPAVMRKTDPEYSEEARTRHYSGNAVLSLVIGTDGNAQDIRVVQSLGMGLDEKAVEALTKWRFRPATKDGSPVKIRVQVEMDFRIL